MAHSLQDITQHVIERAKRNGASAADVMIREDDTFSVSVRMTEVETLKEALSRGLMLRAFVGKRTATSHTSTFLFLSSTNLLTKPSKWPD